MSGYRISGGQRLCGSVRVSGAKNSCLPILSGTILNAGRCVLRNVPAISDTFVSIDILRELGCDVTFENGVLTVDSKDATAKEISQSTAAKMRSSLTYMGSMLGRFGRVTIGQPGGCELGFRRTNLHEDALRKMNAVINKEHGLYKCNTEGLKGARIHLDLPSVGATENIMLAAVLAEGETVITNPAKEPEIVDLQNFLVSMGAKVRGAGTGTIVIEGVKSLHDSDHTIIPDRIVTGTYLVAAAMTGGEIECLNVCNEHIVSITNALMQTGCTIKENDNKIYLKAPKQLENIDIVTTSPHPGFPTDMQPQFTALLSIANGTSVISETMFEHRDAHIPELLKMDAKIHSEKCIFVINGVKELNGTTIKATDLRCGAALILAGLAAKGETIVTSAEHIRRGYEKIEEAFCSLGAIMAYIE